MKQLRPRWSGAQNCPSEQGFCGCRSPVPDAREDHLEGAARWPQFHGRCDGGRRGIGLARRRRAAGRGGRSAGPDARALAGACGDARAARRARPRPGRSRPGRDARRRRRLPFGSARRARPGAAVRQGRVERHGVSGHRCHRRRPSATGRAAGRSRAGARERLERRGRARADRDRHRRDVDHGALREGRRGGHLQGRFWVSPAAGLPRRDARGVGRRAAPGQRRRQHRLRPRRCRRVGARTAPARRRRAR